VRLEYDEVLERLRKIAATDPNKQMSHETAGCKYGTSPERAKPEPQPVCIVGHLLHEVLSLEAWFNLVQGWNRVKIASLLERNSVPGLTVDRRTRTLLSKVQENQDNGIPWGAAVESAVNSMKEEGHAL
jgi:hypothetical protein